MDNRREPVPVRIVWTVLGFLAVAFMAWAGVVWDRSSALLENQQKILIEQAKIEQKLETLMAQHRAHRASPWHRQAGEQIIRMREKLEDHERRLRRK